MISNIGLNATCSERITIYIVYYVHFVYWLIEICVILARNKHLFNYNMALSGVQNNIM